MTEPEVLPADPAQLPAAAAFDPEAVVLDLHGATNRLPEAAIRAVREHRELMVPRLIEVLRQATAQVRAGQKVEGNAHFFALLLLAELHAKEALPAVLEAVSLPGEGPFDLFEDTITSLLAPILLKLSDDPLDLLDRMIADPALNYFVRWEAAEAHLYLVRDGRLTRQQAVDRLRDHLVREMARQDEPGEIITGLVSVLSDLAPNEAYEQIKEAFAKGMVDEFTLRLKDIDESITEGEAGMQPPFRRLRDFDDTIEELRHWASFAAKKPSPPEPPTPQTFQTHNQAPLLAPTAFPARPDPIRADNKVGRNDPCPCGSGKKYKKCCGR